METNLKKYSVQELEELWYSLDVGEMFNRVYLELKRRHEHKQILAGLKI